MEAEIRRSNQAWFRQVPVDSGFLLMDISQWPPRVKVVMILKYWQYEDRRSSVKIGWLIGAISLCDTARRKVYGSRKFRWVTIPLKLKRYVDRIRNFPVTYCARTDLETAADLCPQRICLHSTVRTPLSTACLYIICYWLVAKMDLHCSLDWRAVGCFECRLAMTQNELQARKTFCPCSSLTGASTTCAETAKNSAASATAKRQSWCGFMVMENLSVWVWNGHNSSRIITNLTLSIFCIRPHGP